MSGAESNEKKKKKTWQSERNNQQNEKATYGMKVNIYKPSIRR